MVFSVLISSEPGNTTFSTVSVGFKDSFLNPEIPRWNETFSLDGDGATTDLSECSDEFFLASNPRLKEEHSSP